MDLSGNGNPYNSVLTFYVVRGDNMLVKSSLFHRPSILPSSKVVESRMACTMLL